MEISSARHVGQRSVAGVLHVGEAQTVSAGSVDVIVNNAVELEVEDVNRVCRASTESARCLFDLFYTAVAHHVCTAHSAQCSRRWRAIVVW